MYIHPSTHPFSKREWERPTGSEAPMLNRMHRSCPCSLYLGPGLLCLSVCPSAPRTPLRGQWNTAQPRSGGHVWPGGHPGVLASPLWDQEGLLRLPPFPSIWSSMCSRGTHLHWVLMAE